MVFKEVTIKSEKIYTGKILSLRVDTIKTQDDQEATREIVEHNGAVAVIALTPENKIVMVRQYRKPVEKDVLEIPAGKIEKDEAPRLTAIRELKEETGYEAGKIELISEYYSTPGFSNEKIFLYFASELIKGKQCLDVDEFVDIEEYTLGELETMVKSNAIMDGKSIIGILAVKNFI